MEPLMTDCVGVAVRVGDAAMFTFPVTLAILKQEISESWVAAVAVRAEMASCVGLISLPCLDWCKEVAESAGAMTSGLFSPTATKGIHNLIT